jgi:hypothetical protein
MVLELPAKDLTMNPTEILARIRATFDSYDPTDIDEQDHVLAMILDEEGPEALIQAVLDAAVRLPQPATEHINWWKAMGRTTPDGWQIAHVRWNRDCSPVAQDDRGVLDAIAHTPTWDATFEVLVEDQPDTPTSGDPTECAAKGCDEEALTQSTDGGGRSHWLCERHGDDLAVGFPLKAPVSPSPTSEKRWTMGAGDVVYGDDGDSSVECKQGGYRNVGLARYVLALLNADGGLRQAAQALLGHYDDNEYGLCKGGDSTPTIDALRAALARGSTTDTKDQTDE